MFFDYRFWHYVTRPHDLATAIQTSEMRQFNRRLVIVFITGILLFVLRNLWGLNTESLTALLTTMSTSDYIIARYASLAGTIIWSAIYIAFHLFGVAYILSLLTKVPYKQLVPLQLLVTGLLLLEKALLFGVFAIKGSTVSLSFLSFGPLAVTIMDNWYLILFMNQLTIFSALIITLQYRYIRTFIVEGKRKEHFWMIIGLHVAMALVTAAVAFIPFDTLLNSVFGGGF
ncbi:hypothetical protein H9649_08460 [Sporosarcina sp. Sa2YVA2]|uniref:Yip1 domain-containing protein n=1 Tax=Sporosarcina quadrami TaxID=2762234 RepID=A0ABR8U989_9BACL|nr:hypothetical protein [Sporosarcina quadrami]MBD7984609.1 hypothetical protein [Sporosarcina quadrami]